MSKWFEGWYLSYGLLGIGAAGLLPILLPLVVSPRESALALGLVLAAFSLGGLSAPLWGRLADRRRIHRSLLVGGMAGVALTSALLSTKQDLAGYLVLALLVGAGIAAASTVANLFIVEVHPQPEWDSRIGWLQTFYGIGQVLGLVAAGALSRSGSSMGLWVAGGVSAVAILPALTSAPKMPRNQPVGGRPSLAHPARHAEWPPGSPQRHYHHLGGRALGWLVGSADPSFFPFLLGWFVAYAGSAAFFALYPVVMREAYGVGPAVSAYGFAVSAGLGLLLFAPAGRWSTGGRSPGVLRAGLAVRLVAYIGLAVLSRVILPSRGAIALAGFLLVVLAWSAVSVASTALVAEASVSNEGSGIGVFNAVTALSAVAGTAAGGAVAGAWGYRAVPILSAAATAVGLAILFASRPTAPRLRLVSTPLPKEVRS